MWVLAILIEPKPRKGLQHIIQCLLHSNVVQLAGHARPDKGQLARHTPAFPGDVSSNVLVHEGYYLRRVQDGVHSPSSAVIDYPALSVSGVIPRVLIESRE